MKRFLVVALLASVAAGGTAVRCQASGAFGLFYCPKYCASYCNACCPFNAFSSNGCSMGCCPPTQWPQTGGGCGAGGCGAGGCGAGGCANGPACGPCGTSKAPHALWMVSSSPQHLGPVQYNGMESYGLGGLRGHGGVLGHNGCKGGKCAAGGCGSEAQGGNHGYGMMQQQAAPYWAANMTPEQAAANYMQQVSYYGYANPAQVMPYWGYGYGYGYNPAMWGAYGYQQGR